LSLCLIKHHNTKSYGGVEIQLHAFLTSTPDEGQLHAPAISFRRKSPQSPFDRRLCGLQSRPVRGSEEKNLWLCRKSIPGRPAYSL